MDNPIDAYFFLAIALTFVFIIIATFVLFLKDFLKNTIKQIIKHIK